MDKPKLHRREITVPTGEKIRLVFDESTDMLDIFFAENEPATGIEITDQILLRLNQQTGQVVSLMIGHFSILTEVTEFGPRSFPINNFAELPEDLRDLIVRSIVRTPVNLFLRLTNFQASPSERVPLAFVEPQHLLSAA